MIDKEARTIFIYMLCEKYTRTLLETGVITEEQFRRINKRCSEHCAELDL